MNKTFKVLHFDSCTITKIGFQTIVDQLPYIEFLNVKEQNSCLQTLRLHLPDILVINKDTIEQNIVQDIVDHICRSCKKIKVILVSNFISVVDFTKFKDKGVLGFLSIQSNQKQIATCLEQITNDDPYMNPEFCNYLSGSLISIDRKVSKLKSKDGLTTKEVKVIELIIKGKKTIEIADILFNSKRTIETHRRNIAEKLDLQGQGALTRHLMQHKDYYYNLVQV